MSTGPDTVLLNGKIATLDRAKPAARALAIEKGRITAAGADRDRSQGVLRALGCSCWAF
ncbi:MAG: hypothetical protein ACLP0B_22255 [Steroidobacteraceae bacterium]|jgi:predicted amidohydrolase YtcJ